MHADPRFGHNFTVLSPSRDEYLKQAELGGPIPIYRDVLADMETPLSAYWKLAHDETHSFLLESVTGGENLARYSMIGVRPRLVVRSKGRSVRLNQRGNQSQQELEDGEDPLAFIRREIKPVRAELLGDLPKFCGGAVGMISYDYARFVEDLPDSTEDDLEMDDVAMLIVDSMVVFDHAKNLVRIVALADGTDDGYDDAKAEIERIRSRLLGPIPPLPTYKGGPSEVTSNIDRETFEAAVRKVINYIGAGDCIQAVPSIRFETEVGTHSLTVYRALRSLNPSPYMFYIRFGDFDIVGASPELLVGLSGRTARVRPIAGTRPRGDTPEADLRLEVDLLQDEKERAEHIMLVDLGRNDLGRVCEYGTVEVDELMVVERYSHVMHIVSSVTGVLREGMDGIDLVRACFPAGTVTGAPKVRAMEIIDELEGTRRGLYAGAIGYLSATGEVDLAIAIRTILMKDGKAYVQAGAGIVYDSVPSREYDECTDKAKAALRAIEIAQSGLDSGN
ncbi:MAG: anthranilate synthase component I [Armatimonadetes bacterium]|nr:anthranilate synthase component I [Armatimonadota bacterium]